MFRFCHLVSLLSAILVLEGSSFGQNLVVHDPNAESRTVGDFHAIDISGGMKVYLSQADQPSLAVSAQDPQVRAKIHSQVEDGVLRIYLEKGNWKWFWSEPRIKVYIAFKDLDLLKASGACDLTFDGWVTTPKWKVDLSGASDLKAAVKCGALILDQSGASDVSLKGEASKVQITLSGASDVKAFDLVTQESHVEVSGASDVKITVNGDLYASASGASSIHYRGTGVIRDMHSSGASSISKSN